MKAVIFNRAHLMYQRGETAGFPDDHAQKLIDAGIARDPEAPLVEVGQLGPELVILSRPVMQPSDNATNPKAAAGQAEGTAEKDGAATDLASGSDLKAPAGQVEGAAEKDGAASAPESEAKPATADAKDEPGAPPAQGKRR